jgi:hypothetical protein
MKKRSIFNHKYSISLKTFLAVGLIFFTLMSCGDDNDDVTPEENVGTLSISPSTVVLSEESAAAIAVTLSWQFPQAGTNYVVQFSINDNFSSPVEVVPSTNSSHTFTHEALNTFVKEELNLTAGTAGQVKVRVKTNTADYSNVVSVTVTPYQEKNVGTLTVTPSTVVLSEESAAANAVTLSWEFTQAGTNYVVQFSKNDDFGSPVEVAPSSNSSHTFTHEALNTLAKEELKLTAGTAGQVKVRVKTNTADYSNVVSMTVTPYDKKTDPVYVNAWIIGNATPAGWDWEAAKSQQLQQSTENDKVIFIILELKAGEFKIGTVHGNWNEEPFYRPAFPENPQADQLAPLSHTAVQLTNQQNSQYDHKWVVAEGEAGTYKISINTETMIASFDRN